MKKSSISGGMIHNLVIIFVMASVIFVSGCGTPKVWYRPGTTPQQTEMDKAECRLRYQQIVLGTPTVRVAVGENANAGEGWGGAIGGAIERGHFVDDCMIAKGYQFVPITQATNYSKQLGP